MSKKVLFRILAVVGALVLLGACVVFAIIPGYNAVATRAKAEVKAVPTAEVVAKVDVPAEQPAAPQVAEPTKAPDPTAAPAVAKVEDKPTPAPVEEKPLTAEDAKQVGSGADIITGWEDPSATAQIIGASFSPVVRSFMAAEGTTPAETKVVCVSSDPGLIQKKDSSGKVLVSWRDDKRGFVACVVLNPGETVEVIGVGFNEANGHFNTWSEIYSVPKDVKPNDVAANQLAKWEDREKKPFAFSFDDGADKPTFLTQPK